MATKICDITSKKIENLEVIAKIKSKSGVGRFGADGKYMSLVLLDEMEIKLTLFNDNVLKSEELKVCEVNSFININIYTNNL